MLNQGIPIFRLPRNIIKKEIDQVLDYGIKIQYEKEIKLSERLLFSVEKYEGVSKERIKVINGLTNGN